MDESSHTPSILVSRDYNYYRKIKVKKLFFLNSVYYHPETKAAF
jgi:hypothetical protein